MIAGVVICLQNQKSNTHGSYKGLHWNNDDDPVMT